MWICFLLACVLINGFLCRIVKAEEDSYSVIIDTHEDFVNCIAFSPDGNLLASGGTDNSIHIFSVSDLEVITELKSERSVDCICFSPDSKFLASGCFGDDIITFWDITNRRVLSTLAIHDEYDVEDFAINPDGNMMAVALDDGNSIGLWNLSTGNFIRNLTLSEDKDCRAVKLCFSPDGNILACGYRDGPRAVALWDVIEGNLLKTLGNQDSGCVTLSFSPDGNILAAGVYGYRQSGLMLWNLSNDTVINPPMDDCPSFSDLKFSPDGTILAAGGSGLLLIDVSEPENLSLIWEEIPEEPGRNPNEFSPDGKLLATIAEARYLRIYDVDRILELASSRDLNIPPKKCKIPWAGDISPRAKYSGQRQFSQKTRGQKSAGRINIPSEGANATSQQKQENTESESVVATQDQATTTRQSRINIPSESANATSQQKQENTKSESNQTEQNAASTYDEYRSENTVDREKQAYSQNEKDQREESSASTNNNHTVRSSSASTKGQPLIAAFSSTTPNIDGFIHESEWQNANRYNLKFHSMHDRENSISIPVLFQTDGDFLYIAAITPFVKSPKSHLGFWIDGDDSKSFSGVVSEFDGTPHVDIGVILFANDGRQTTVLIPQADSVKQQGVLLPAFEYSSSEGAETSFESRILLSDVTSGMGKSLGIEIFCGDEFNSYIFPAIQYLDIHNWHTLLIGDTRTSPDPKLHVVEFIGKSKQCFCQIYDIFHFNKKIFAGTDEGMIVIDVTDPATPEIMNVPRRPQGNIPYNSCCKTKGVFVNEEYALLADDFAGFMVVDISDLANPTLVMILESDASSVFAQGKYAYFTRTGIRLFSVDIFNVGHPEFVDMLFETTPELRGEFNDVFYSQGFAYVAAGSAGLLVVETKDGKFRWGNMMKSNISYLDTQGDARRVFVSQDVAYLADGASGIQIIDVSDPYNPSLLGTCDTPGFASAVWPSGDYLFVADGQSGLTIIDKTVLRSPQLVCWDQQYLVMSGSAVDVFVDRGYVYLGNAHSLQVFKIAN